MPVDYIYGGVDMALIPDVKCSRCDRHYSGLRGKCPYCGARRSKKGKRVSPNDNATWKLAISLLLLVILVAAVIVLAIGSGRDAENSSPDDSSSVSTSSVDGETSDSSDSADGSDASESSDASDTTDTSDTPDSSDSSDSSESSTSSVTPSGGVEAVTITYLGDPRDDITMTIGEVLPLGYQTTPAGIEATALWDSSDDDVFTVTQSGTLTAIAAGEAELTVTVDGVTARCIIRVN